MIQFSKLRLHGFKSFVEKTELDIGPGLTGIVGPNGCGKSNLVEALRWSMGENSSKRMRGGSGSMDDVIFAGTEKRPARNTAEVTVVLDNSRRDGPAAYGDSDEIEVVRKIEREHGSGYRINGKPVRARDVQLLYADITSGAGSPFLVSQGKITNMIQAKPLERRMILEEAAGITGLYARRHEAELRLRATDANLKRVEDLMAGMDSRLEELKKQARQATRYRNLAAQIRQLEVMIASMEWRRAHEKLTEIQRTFDAAESIVVERLTTVTQLNKTQNVQAEDLPGLRQQDAEMAAGLQTLKIALQRLEDESQRLTAQREEAQGQLEQTRRDRTHEQEMLTENSAVLEKLETEEKGIFANRDQEDEELQRRTDARKEKQEAVNTLEETYSTLVEQHTTGRARKQGLEQQAAQDSQRRDSIRARLETVKQQLAEKKAAQENDSAVPALREEIETLEQTAATLHEQVSVLEDGIESARAAQQMSRNEAQAAETRLAKIEAEIETLESIVAGDSEEGFRPVFEDIRTDEGFELALSRALGDTLMASSESGAPVSWQKRDIDTPPLPGGVKPLAPHIKAPDVLQLALGQIGLVDSEAHGNELAAQLKPGQALVSREGAYWRWDGLTVRVTASDRHAVQLRHKNRLAELQKIVPDAESDVEYAGETQAKAEAEFTETKEILNTRQRELQECDHILRRRRAELNHAIEAQAGRQAELAKLGEGINIAETDLAALEERIAENARAMEQFDEATFAAQQEKIDQARAALAEAREQLHDAITAFEVSRQEHGRRQARLHAIADERVNLQNRCIRARERNKELDEREEQLKTKIEELKKRPVEIKAQSEELLSKIGEKESERAIVSDKLATMESELADTTKALKEAEALLSEAKEARAHAQATVTERQRHMEEVRSFIQEQFNMSPEELGAEAALSDEALPDLEDLKQQKEKAVRSRDLIGPVNLRADIEAEELEKQVTGILSEKNDLVEAVNELRSGIEKLNIEARERLNDAFNKVNEHFRDMFTRLFNGGKAHLALIESDDPLEAGLEIFAQPPGKALQSLSLLSGGEQTLTAIALIFAIFMTNPAPICVLDEVDAPLDDANVDRFCNLLDEFADRGETRFLLITHHRLTMARMDRLYGVTMSEKGVSQLVSVDMNQQLDFLEAAE